MLRCFRTPCVHVVVLALGFKTSFWGLLIVLDSIVLLLSFSRSWTNPGHDCRDITVLHNVGWISRESPRKPDCIVLQSVDGKTWACWIKMVHFISSSQGLFGFVSQRTSTIILSYMPYFGSVPMPILGSKELRFWRCIGRYTRIF